jgi:hypothetical protein
MLLADTVLVLESGEHEVLTNAISKGFGNVSYFIDASLLTSPPKFPP